MKSFFLAALAAAASLGLSAAAKPEPLGISAQVRNPSAPLTSLHAEALIPILSQMGLGYEGATLPGGERVLLVEAPNGQRLQITPVACASEVRCRGMHLVTIYSTAAGERTVAAFNDRYAFVSAGVSGSDIAYLSRYEVADYGVPRGNVAVSLKVFLETAALFREHLETAATDLRKAPDGSDLAAHGLNLKRLVRAPKAGVSQPRLAHPHALSFETTHDTVETFIRAEKLYPGRIVNGTD